MVSNFFSVDFQTLEEGERAILEEVAREGQLPRRAIALAAGRSEEALESQLYGLMMLGYLTQRRRTTIGWATGSSSAGCGGWRRRGRAPRGRSCDRRGQPRSFPTAGRTITSRSRTWARSMATFEVRVYDGGTVLWRKKVVYADIMARALPRLEQDEELRALMEKTLHTVQAAIAKGKLAQ